MFEGLKGMAGLAGLMKDLPRIREKMEEVKGRLADLTVEAESGGGAVRVTANGQLRIIAVRIDPALIGALVDAETDEDRALAEDLIAGAANLAIERARELAERELSAAAAELGLPLPAGGLGGLMS